MKCFVCPSTVSLVALVGLLGCGASQSSSRTPSSMQSGARRGVSNEQARAALASLDEIRSTPACIAPDMCEDLSWWRPTAAFQLDQSLVVVGERHAFVREAEQWKFIELPKHGALLSNGHSAFFCGGDQERYAYELTTAGVTRHGAPLSDAGENCVVVAAGEQLYSSSAAGMLRATADGWASVDSVNGDAFLAMAGSRAFVATSNESGRLVLLELASSATNQATRELARASSDGASPGRMFDISRDDGALRLAILGGDAESHTLALFENGRLSIVPTPYSLAERQSQRELDEPAEEGERRHSDEEELDAMFSLQATFVGVDPPMIERVRRQGPLQRMQGGALMTMQPYYQVWDGTRWSTIDESSAPAYHLGLAMHSAEVDRDPFALEGHYGNFRIALVQRDRFAGPSMLVWPNSAMTPVVSALQQRGDGMHGGGGLALSSSGICAGQSEQSERSWCMLLPNGSAIRSTTRDGVTTIEGINAAGTVELRHEGQVRSPSSLLFAEHRLYVNDERRGFGFVDDQGWHDIVLPRGEVVRRIELASGADAYVGTEHKLFFVHDGRAEAIASSENLRLDYAAYAPSMDGGGVFSLSRGDFAQVMGTRVETFALPTLDDVMEVSAFSTTSAAGAVLVTWGRTFVVRGDHLFEARRPESASLDAFPYLMKSMDGAHWQIGSDCMLESFVSQCRTYRTNEPPLTDLGPLSQFAAPMPARGRTLATLSSLAFAAQGPGARARRALRHDPKFGDAEALRAYLARCAEESDDENAAAACESFLRPPQQEAASIVADAQMRNVIAWNMSCVAHHAGTGPATVESTQGGASDAQARALMTTEGLALARSFALNEGDVSSPARIGIIPNGAHAGEMIRVRVERDQMIVELIDRDNTRATRLHRQAMPRPRCERGDRSCPRAALSVSAASASSSEDGAHVAVFVQWSYFLNDFYGPTAHSLWVLNLPALPR